jgi:hypothetical protein
MKYKVLVFLINIIVVNCGIYNYFNQKIFNYNIKYIIKNNILDNILDNKIISNTSNINILDIAILF